MDNFWPPKVKFRCQTTTDYITSNSENNTVSKNASKKQVSIFEIFLEKSKVATFGHHLPSRVNEVTNFWDSLVLIQVETEKSESVTRIDVAENIMVETWTNNKNSEEENWKFSEKKISKIETYFFEKFSATILFSDIQVTLLVVVWHRNLTFGGQKSFIKKNRAKLWV